MAELFASSQSETRWERARRRRKLFTSPGRELLVASVGLTVVGKFVFPLTETVWWWLQLPRLEAEDQAEHLRAVGSESTDRRPTEVQRFKGARVRLERGASSSETSLLIDYELVEYGQNIHGNSSLAYVLLKPQF